MPARTGSSTRSAWPSTPAPWCSGAVLHLTLPALDGAQIVALCESMAGPTAPEVTETVARLSEDSPFMAAAVMRGLVESDLIQYRADGSAFSPGFEALARWVRPHGMILGPDQFIPLAEESGVIVGLGSWVLKEACRQARRWRDQTGSPLTMAVNVSAPQLLHIVNLAGALDLQTVAERVETLDQLEALSALGCTHAQGYNWKRPCPAEEISAWMAEGSPPRPRRDGRSIARPSASGSPVGN